MTDSGGERAAPGRSVSASDGAHVCDDGCVCPIHGTPLIYWPHGDDHACQDITCRYGHGMNAELLAKMPPLRPIIPEPGRRAGLATRPLPGMMER